MFAGFNPKMKFEILKISYIHFQKILSNKAGILKKYDLLVII